MVSWASDGRVAGYSPIDEEWSDSAFFLASPGVVDLQGGTRLQRYLPAQQIDPANNIRVTVNWTVTAGDLAHDPPIADVGPMVFLAQGGNWAADYVPTVTEIVNLAFWQYWPSGFVSTPQTKTWTIDGFKPSPGQQVSPNTKIWVAVVPAAHYHAGEDPEPVPEWMESVGRALSVWSNRSPGKPTITSPPSGTEVAPGASFNLVYSPADPDALTPDGSNGSNADLAGVQIQYAAPATPDNPNPTWTDLPRVNLDGSTSAYSWYIKGSVYGTIGDSELLTSRGSSITCGADDVAPGNGVLPGGTWQIRLRTFDHGHPYPNIYRPAGFTTGGFDPASMPASLVSPWSDPITITTPSPVSSPLLISPVNDVAVPEGLTLRMQWKHRSAYVTPKGQSAREVQIRKFGDPNWTTVFAGMTSQEYVDLPPNYIAPPDVLPTEYLADGGFEGGTLDGWFARDWADDLDGSQSIANANVAGRAHSGTRYLVVVNDGQGLTCPAFSKIVTLDPGHDTFDFTGWYFPLASIDYAMYFTVEWLDASNNPLPEDQQPANLGRFMSDDPWTVETWVSFSVHLDIRPPGAVKARLSAMGFGLTTSNYSGTRLDDVSFIGSSSFNMDDFTLDATNRYEWRARTRDTSGDWSTYSPSEKFWVVPGAGSGGVRPVPSQTIQGATLGCGQNRVFVVRRGGTIPVGEITNPSLVRWGRTRDDISHAQVEISDFGVDCGELLKRLQTWAYELVIVRTNGFSSERVWEGPITQLIYERGKVTIKARDVMVYAYRRILRQEMNDSGSRPTAGTSVVDRARRVLQNAFAPDDPNVLAYLKPITRDDDAKQYRSTPAYARTAFEEVDDMASNAGLDYVAVGRSILLWGTKNRIGTLPEFRDSDLGASPIVSEYGMSLANRYVVSNGNGVWGEANRLDVSGNDPTYGLVEMLSSSWASDSEDPTGTYSQSGLQTVIESFEGFAERSIADRYPAPVVVRVPENTTLHPDTVISIQQLVPGVAIPLRSTGTLRAVYSTHKLDAVTVEQTSTGEEIRISMSPFSRDDTGESEGPEE